MSLESAIYSYVQSVSAITDEIGARFYVDLPPASGEQQDHAVFTIVSDVPEYAQSGAAGLTQALVQIDVYSVRSSQRRVIVEAFRQALQGRNHKTLGTEALCVRSVALDNTRNVYEEPGDNSQGGMYRAIMEFSIWYAQSVPVF